jgi:hypothetical protein
MLSGEQDRNAFPDGIEVVERKSAAVYRLYYQPECFPSSILYPTTDKRAKEARIDVTDPIFGKFLGQVCLRPVHLPTIVELVTTITWQGHRVREAYAIRLAFGEASKNAMTSCPLASCADLLRLLSSVT